MGFNSGLDMGFNFRAYYAVNMLLVQLNNANAVNNCNI